MRSKRIKFGLVAALLPVMAFSVSAATLTAFADEVSVDEMREYLIGLELPEEYVNTLNENKLAETYNSLIGEYLVYGGTEEVYLSEFGDIKTRETITRENLRFNINYYLHFPNDDGYYPIEDIRIIINYDWEIIPTYLKTDAVLVNWDPDVFTYSAGSFYAYGYFERNYKQIKYDYEDPAMIMQDSLGYDVQLGTVNGAKPDRLFGYASFTLLPAKNPTYWRSHNITAVNAQYRHLYDNITASVGFGTSGGSVTFATTENTSTVAVSANIPYSYEIGGKS